MVRVVVLGVEASQEVAADDSYSEVKDIYFVELDMQISNPPYWGLKYHVYFLSFSGEPSLLFNRPAPSTI
jgi:hypothetical protein